MPFSPPPTPAPPQNAPSVGDSVCLSHAHSSPSVQPQAGEAPRTDPGSAGQGGCTNLIAVRSAAAEGILTRMRPSGSPARGLHLRCRHLMFPSPAGRSRCGNVPGADFPCRKACGIRHPAFRPECMQGERISSLNSACARPISMEDFLTPIAREYTAAPCHAVRPCPRPARNRSTCTKGRVHTSPPAKSAPRLPAARMVAISPAPRHQHGQTALYYPCKCFWLGCAVALSRNPAVPGHPPASHTSPWTSAASSPHFGGDMNTLTY